MNHTRAITFVFELVYFVYYSPFFFAISISRHIPKVKATTIAETPELKRIAENTKIQSNVKYHADFEKQKGKLTQVADDPETLRLRQNTKNISNVAYHGDLQKKAIMEKQRETTEIVDSKGELIVAFFACVKIA